MTSNYTMDFSFTDELYDGDLNGYQEFLKISIEEFETDYPKLKQALNNHDPELFSAVKHKFSTRLSTFQLVSLQAFMEDVKNNYKNDISAVDPIMAGAELDRHISGILTTLKNKLAQLQ
ncbi:hypothetical protein [Sediminitomix flava]|uniref:Hpt domain-containing protein n=1 Tax=Sediminitomix flava TaxID=379075 RepID=A0A315Z136_SEDFL|nr:hypothetical protein [Sediminitomix flava]PWJ36134.1 hypothetical protein BC781_109150 [Sediminitomix flava]